jgi:hypothetical protein
MTPVARIETLCKPLGRRVLVSAELASAVGNKIQLEPARCASSPRSARAERNFRFAAKEDAVRAVWVLRNVRHPPRVSIFVKPLR